MNLIGDYFRAFCLANNEKVSTITQDIDFLFKSFTVVNRFLSRKLIKIWIAHNSWALRTPTSICADEYLVLSANSYDRTKLISDNLSKNEYLHRAKRNGVFNLHGSFSQVDPDERLDKLLGRIHEVNISYDFQDPNYIPNKNLEKKVKHKPVKGQLEKIIIRTFSNHRLAPNPYCKISGSRNVSRSASKLSILKTKPSVNVKPLIRSRSCAKPRFKKENSINLSRKNSNSALGLGVHEEPYHISTLREAVLITYRTSRLSSIISKP